MSECVMFKRAAKLLFLFVAVLLLLACGSDTRPHFKLAGSTMGTSYHITVIEPDSRESNQQELQAAIDQQLVLINQQMSTYIADSELSRLNHAAVGEWVTVSPNLFDVLMMSLELSWLSNGAFDITVGPLVNLWGFGPGPKALVNTVPSAEAVSELLAATGFEAIQFNLLTRQVSKQKPVTLDLSAIAKGFAVDKLAELLIYAGYNEFMLEVGGELRLQGNSPKSTPWRIAIEQPSTGSIGRAHQALSLNHAAVATSGDYRNYFEQGGIRYSHTINPASGYPIKHALASVTVVADSAAYADGLATAISVMGPDKGMLLAQQQELAIYLIISSDEGFEERYSDAFKRYLE